jgi:nucleoid-associated protein YgaU
MQRAKVFVVGAAIVVSAILLGGCSRTTARHMDVTAGEYYSEEEFDKLPRRAKENYCSSLGQELAKLQGQVEKQQDELKDTRKEIESLRNQITPIEREILRIDSDIRTLTGQIAELEALPKTWTVKPGETIDIIAAYDEVYSDPTKWPRIYRANIGKIEDPMWIYPDTVLLIPRDWPVEHRVSEYETLEIIAGYWEVYGNPLAWTRLYEANRGKVSDPFVLEPGQVISIPRD